MSSSDETFLNDCWTLYFHDPDNDKWDAKSYQIIHNISTVEDWVDAHASFQNMWHDGMFFLMREHILPLWEDPHNQPGGCLSFKVSKPDVKEYWFQLGAKCLGEVLAKQGVSPDIVCGVSISPKRSFCILRVWLSQPAESDQFHLEAPHYSQVMYKSHIDHISHDHNA